MRDATTQDRRRNERAKLWIFCEMEKVATCSTTDGNGSYHGLAPSFFEEMTLCRRHKHWRPRPDNPNGPSKFRKYCVHLPLLRLFTFARSQLLFRGWWQQQLPRTFVFWRDDTLPMSKLHWIWPGSPNGRLKLRNLCLFTFTRSQLTLRRRLRSWWRLSKIAQTDVKKHCSRRQKTLPGWPGLIEIPQIWKFMPTRLSKMSRKTSFCCYEWRRDWRHCALFFFLLSLAMALVLTFEK